MKKKYHFFLFFLVFCINTQAQIITTLAGNGTGGNGGDGGPATNASIWYPTGIAVDKNNNLFVCSAYTGPFLSTNKIRKVNTTGIISTFAGTDTMGFSGDGGPATAARLYQPEGITFDKKGNVYFFDDGNKRVRKVDTNGIITTFAGNGAATATGDGGAATAAGIGNGIGICIDTAGNIYIGAANKIRKVATTGIITTIAGTGLDAYGGDGGPASAANFSTNGQIAIDRYGNLYIVDVFNLRIRKINSEGIINTVAGNGTQGNSGDGGPATAAQFYSPVGVFADNCDNIYITDGWYNRIRVVNGAGIIKNFAGNGYDPGIGTGGYSGDGGPATAAELNGPAYLYIDKNGSIYINDGDNYRVRYIHMDSCMNTEGVRNTALPLSAVLILCPNPADGLFTINMQSPVDEPAEVVITDIVGRVVQKITTVTNKEMVMDIKSPKGLYLVCVSTTHGRYVRQLVIE